ncbi:hypothetical protein F9C28_03010 [Shimwellia pseudoproteus]|uniref:hypothetical protein n=1 Tax=Shimwellia pseudoproteus TaxID=570012 RepID=UPI0018EC4C88|nr:hypothetical protein [Shimwellia pseudoproteus]MBJ3813924.1 hypothetical protein [Shimwellia pseudoproteus]
MADLIDFTSRHFGKLAFTWIILGFVGWTSVAYFAWNSGHAGSLGGYVLTSWLAWGLFHLAPSWAMSMIFWVRRRITPPRFGH